MAADLTIRDVRVYQVPILDTRGNSKQVTRVQMFVGVHGPFVEDFGPGMAREDSTASIQQWQRDVVTKLDTIAGV